MSGSTTWPTTPPRTIDRPTRQPTISRCGWAMTFSSRRTATTRSTSIATQAAVAAGASTSHETSMSCGRAPAPIAIVYENGGWLYRFDPASGESPPDWLLLWLATVRQRLPRVVEAVRFIESADLSPNGKRVLYPAPRRNLQCTGRKRARAKLSHARRPPGKSTQAGHRMANICLLVRRVRRIRDLGVSQVGGGRCQAGYEDGAIWRFPPVWSPDSSMLISATRIST